jgi:hypothetical protein
LLSLARGRADPRAFWRCSFWRVGVWGLVDY